MAATAATIQQLFAAAILATLDTLEDGDLKSLAEKKTESGGESATFYRIKGGKAKDGVPSMYVTGTYEGDTDNKGDGGDTEKFVATIGQVSSQDKVKKADMLKTKLDIKTPIVKTMSRSILLKEDDKILTAIKAKASELNTAGSVTADPTALETARLLVAEIRDAHVSAQMTPDGKKGVAVVMNRQDYKRLATSDAFLNGDYKDQIKGGDGELPLSFVGARLVVSPLVESGEIYIIPSNTFGYAEWEGSIESTAEYHPTDSQRYHLQIVKSVGVVVIEPEFITKFQVKPAPAKTNSLKA